MLDAYSRYMVRQGRIQDFRKGGSFIFRAAAMPKAQRCVVMISLREAWKTISPLFFSYQDGLSWHLRALHCKFQM